MKQSRKFIVSLLEKHPISYITNSCILVLCCSKMSDPLLTGQRPSRLFLNPIRNYTLIVFISAFSLETTSN